MAASGFAIIDFETTGLFPGGHDRVIEVAVVHADPRGLITGAWETLVNPGRDLGQQDIHRIRSSEILFAPTFEQIASRLVELLSDRVFVAHNANFDTRFLVAELNRLNYPLPKQLAAICTMQLARDFLPGAGRTLSDCCAAYNIELKDEHKASTDAIATAQLLRAYILSNPAWHGWSEYLELAMQSEWQQLQASSAQWLPRGVQTSRPANFLQRITEKLEEFAGPAEQLDYLALLDECLLDRHLSEHEKSQLVDFAEGLGISRTTCIELHLRYFRDLVSVAWADHILTPDELADLSAVAQLLSIPNEVLLQATCEPPAPSRIPSVRATFRLELGDLVVLTGEMSRSREEWHQELRLRGFVPWDAVTKKVKLLVAADPDSLSGKARKARDYNIPVVGEHALAGLLTT